MKKNKIFSLTLCSDLDFEGMVVDLKYKGHPIATANYDKSIEHVEIKILKQEGLEKLAFPLDELISALQQTKELLQRCAKEDKEK